MNAPKLLPQNQLNKRYGMSGIKEMLATAAYWYNTGYYCFLFYCVSPPFTRLASSLAPPLLR
jgi:hypothetical protein